MSSTTPRENYPLFERIIVYNLQCYLLNGSNGLLSSIIEVGSRDDSEARVLKHLNTLSDVGTLKTNNKGNLEVEVTSSSNDTFSNDIALHDTTEDVDEDSLDLGIRGEDLESLLDLLGGSTTTDIEEVSGGTTVELNNIHGSHGETSTVHHAADVTIETDVVEVEEGSSDFTRVLHGGITESEDLLLAESSVIIEVDLGIDAVALAVSNNEGVDLDLSSIKSDEHLVEVLELLHRISLDGILEAEDVSSLGDLLVLDALHDVDRDDVDGLGLGSGDLLDVHTTLGGDDEDGATVGTVHDNGEVLLGVEGETLVDEDLLDELTLRGGLLGHEEVTEHLASNVSDGLRRLSDVDTTLETSGGEVTLTTTTSVNLRLDDELDSTYRDREEGES